MSAGLIVAQKLGPQVAQKVAAKFTMKLGAKATTRWIPFVSAVVGGGVNWWMADGICTAVDGDCRFIKRSARSAASITIPKVGCALAGQRSYVAGVNRFRCAFRQAGDFPELMASLAA